MMGGATLGDGSVHYYVAVCHRGYVRYFMAHEQNCGRAVKVADDVVYFLLKLFVYVAERLVQHQYLRPADYGPRQQGALLLSAGQCADRLVSVVRQLHELHRLGYFLPTFGPAKASSGQKAGLYDLCYRDRIAGIDARFLGEIADGYVGATAGHSAACRLQQAQNQTHKRSLAATVRSGDSHKITPVDSETRIVKHTPPAQHHAYVAQPYQSLRVSVLQWHVLCG